MSGLAVRLPQLPHPPPLRRVARLRQLAAAQPPAGRGAGAQGAAAGGGRGRGQEPPPTGLTVKGEVKNFARVTDEMLRNPAPGDWPMLRRDQFASSYSPLTQITRDNAQDLQLRGSGR